MMSERTKMQKIAAKKISDQYRKIRKRKITKSPTVTFEDFKRPTKKEKVRQNLPLLLQETYQKNTKTSDIDKNGSEKGI